VIRVQAPGFRVVQGLGLRVRIANLGFQMGGRGSDGAHATRRRPAAEGGYHRPPETHDVTTHGERHACASSHARARQWRGATPGACVPRRWPEGWKGCRVALPAAAAPLFR
jgi:hypothetical protein